MAVTINANSKANVRQTSSGDLISNLSQPVIARYSATSTAGQTTINLSFLVDQSNTDAFFLFVNGQKLTIGSSADFTFSAIDQSNSSSTITLNVPLVANLPIEAFKMGLKKEVEFATDSRFTQLYAMESAGFQGFIDESSKLTAVSGSPASGQFRTFGIVNRASIPDLANDIKARMGVDRIQIQKIAEIPNEFGPNGERVYGAVNDDRGLIRFIGSWTASSTSFGSFINTTVANDTIEIVFYGTGLNLLFGFINESQDVRITVDGGSEGGNIWPNGDTVNNSRNYFQNNILNACSGLSLGLHSVKVRQVNIGSSGMYFGGYEVLNESSSIKIQPGTAYYQGKKMTLSAQSSIAYNTSFESIIRDGASQSSISTRGGHVLAYLKSDGTIGKAIIEANSSSATLGSADHTNEEVSRIFNPREFGAGRSGPDDFSLGTGNFNRAFVLDDNTTGLFGQNTQISAITPEGLSVNGSGDYITVTFVGTGLDITISTDGSTRAFEQVTIDGGSSIGSISKTANTAIETRKVVSGLPYGTHIVTFTRTTGASSVCINKLIVYQPKKPSLPSGAIELADYFILANFVANTTGAPDKISTGIIRKDAYREFVYVNGTGGSVNFGNLGPVRSFNASQTPGYGELGSDRLNAYATYTFFGTGFDLRGTCASNRCSTVQLSLNGLNITTTNFGTMTSSTYGGFTFNSSTGILSENGSTNFAAGVVISGLPLGLYTLKINNSLGTSGQYMNLSCLDVITPIYSPKSNLPADLQNTLLIGNSAISDNRKLSPVKSEDPKKVRLQAQGISSGPTTTSTSYIPIPDMSLTVQVQRAAWYKLTCSIPIQNSGANNSFIAFFVDGIQVGTEQFQSTSFSFTVCNDTLVYLMPGVHKIDVCWKVGAGTVNSEVARRSLLVEEL